jgi:alkylation response protein AidB-like acyl-CoA dehydrogenase
MTLLGPDHAAFRRRVRAFVEEHLTPHADAWERAQTVPREVFAALGAAGLLGLTRDPAFGGQGLDFGHTIVLAEELPRSHMMGLALSVVAQTNIFPPLLASLGTDSQKRDFLAPAIRGEKIGALASSEPAGGSDIVRATHTTAVDEGDFWVVTGEKKYITNGPIADFVIALVRTRPEPSTQSFTLLIVPTDTPGFTVKETMQKIGMHTSPTGWLAFDACRVPKANTLGRVHLGYHYLTQNLLEERLVGGATAIGAAALVLHDTMAYLRERQAYERRLADLQAVRHRVAEMAAEVEMARRFVHSVAERFRDGHVEAKEICMIKFHVFETAQRVVERCLQLQGGWGFLEENWMARVYRDVRMITVGGGTSELMKDLVAAYLRL